MGSGRKWPLAPTLPRLPGLSTFSPSSRRGPRVSRAPAPSQRAPHLASGSSTLIPRDPSGNREPFSRPPRVRGHPHPHRSALRSPGPFPLPPRGAPGRRVRNGPGYLGPRARDSERQQPLLSRRSSLSQPPLLTSPQGWSQGGRPWPLPSRRAAPGPRFCPPAVMNGKAVPRRQTSS